MPHIIIKAKHFPYTSHSFKICIFIHFFFLAYYHKSTSITKRSVSQENAFKERAKTHQFLGSNNPFILNENNLGFLR